MLCIFINTMSFYYWTAIRKKNNIVTARKLSLRRLCFYTCLSVILFTRRQVPPPPGRYTHNHPRAGTPPGRYTHNHPRAGTPPGRYTPSQQVHPPGRYTPRPQCMLGYGQQAGGMHPTGMHSCLISQSSKCSFSNTWLHLFVRVSHNRRLNAWRGSIASRWILTIAQHLVRVNDVSFTQYMLGIYVRA